MEWSVQTYFLITKSDTKRHKSRANWSDFSFPPNCTPSSSPSFVTFAARILTRETPQGKFRGVAGGPGFVGPRERSDQSEGHLIRRITLAPCLMRRLPKRHPRELRGLASCATPNHDLSCPWADALVRIACCGRPRSASRGARPSSSEVGAVFFAIGSWTIYGDAAGRIKAVLPCSLRLWLSRLLGGLSVFAGCRKYSNELPAKSARDVVASG